MRNRFPGICYRCGRHVEAQQGHFESVTKAHRERWPKLGLGKWLTQHAECAIKYRGTTTHHLYEPDAGDEAVKQQNGGK